MARPIARDDIDACGLTYDQLQELWLGEPHSGSHFDSPEELKQAWEASRDLVMRLWGQHGRRPQAWWFLGDAEALGLKWPGYYHEQSVFEGGPILFPLYVWCVVVTQAIYTYIIYISIPSL